MAEKLMTAGVIYKCITFSKLPNGTLDALARRSIDFANATKSISIRMWQAEFNSYWLQSPIIVQEKECSACVSFCGSCVYPPQVRHPWIVVV